MPATRTKEGLLTALVIAGELLVAPAAATAHEPPPPIPPALRACHREQVRLTAHQRHVDGEPLDLQAVGDGALLLYRAVEVTTKGTRTRRRGELFLQRLGPTGARGPALSLARVDGLAYARVAAVDGGALVLYTVDARVDGDGPQTLHAVLVREGDDGWQVGASQSWGKIATAYGLQLARSGDRLAALYLTQGTAYPGALTLQLLGRAGAVDGDPLRLGPANLDARLAVDPTTGEFWLASSEAGKTSVRVLGSDGRETRPTLALAGQFGALVALWPGPAGFALAYQKNFTLGSVPGDTMAFYLQRFDAAGGPLGAPEPLSPRSPSDPSWGTLAWRDGAAARVHVQRRLHPDGYAREPNDLHFGPLGGDTRLLTRTLLHEPTLAALADGYLVAWSDARDDTSKACLRVGACVGELYVGGWRRDHAITLAPTRLTQLAVSHPPAALHGRWQALCE